VYGWIKYVNLKFPNLTEIIEIGRSVQKRPLLVLKVIVNSILCYLT